MLYQIINYFFSLLAIVLTLVMLFTFRKPRRITFFSALISGLISLIIPFIFLVLSGQPINLWLVLPFFSFGLILGYLRGITMKLSFVGDQVVGRHALIFLLFWGFSLALNQLLSTLNATYLAAAGVIAITLSAGTQAGFYGILALRRLVLVPPEVDTGRFRNRTVQRITNLGFGGLLVLFFLESLMVSILPMLFQVDLSAGVPLASNVGEISPQAQEEIPGDTFTAQVEPYFSGEQVLVWTRPLAAFLSESEHILYAFEADGSGVNTVYPEPLGAVDSPAPQLSPDNTLWMVTSKRSGDYEQYLMTVDGSRFYQLRYQDAPVTITDWSPDGSQILLVSQATGNFDLLITDREGATWLPLVNTPANEVEGRWSPDGSAIIYQSDQGGNLDIYRTDLLSGETINLTDHPAEDKKATWAANGTRIIYVSDRDGFFGLYHMSPDGWDVELIAQDPNCGFKYTLSPDGEHLIYTSDPYYAEDAPFEGNQDCENTTRTITSLTGGGKVSLEMGLYSEPQWSPDGGKFAFTVPSEGSDFKSDLIVIGVDGSGRVDLTGAGNSIFKYTWAPDGTRLAMIEDVYNAEGTYQSMILVIDATGTNSTFLAPAPWEEEYVYAFNGFSWP